MNSIILIAMSFVVFRRARAARRNRLFWLLLLWICGLAGGFALAFMSTAVAPTASDGIHMVAAVVGTFVCGFLVVFAAAQPVD